MPLAAGQTLTHYEIVGPLGAGGMGEVYRAKDTRLDREVAIKVLPEELANDEERLRRFEREAKTLAALNHPSVAQAYDVDRDGDVAFLVMELVPGEDLAQRLARGPLPWKDAVRVCHRIAEGLAATHDAGIVHRDLKPGNVRLLPDGRVKLLDFGLAKRDRPVDDGASTRELTRTGVILGTLGYLSPEQVEGGKADHRSDQFALGVILHETITGRSPFLRASVPETLSAILRDDAPSLRELNPTVPAPVAWIAERCLARDPAGRYDSTGDLAKELGIVSQRMSELSATSVRDQARRASPSVVSFVVAALALAVTVATFVVSWRASDSESRSPLSYERVTFRRGTVTSARFDPASGDVLYSAAWDGGEKRIQLVRSGSPDAIPVGAAGSELLSVSPLGELLIRTDARPVGPFQQAGRLARMLVTGGPRELATDVVAAVFGPDEDVAALVRTRDDESVLEFPQGTERASVGGMLLNLALSSDGRRLALAESPQLGHEWGRVVVFDRDGSETRFDYEAGRGLAWSPDESELWYVSKDDQTSLEARDMEGRVRTLATFPSSVYLFDVDADGRVLLATEERRYEMAVRRRIGSASAADSWSDDRELTWLSWSVPFDLSADGERILFNEWTGARGRVALRGLGAEPPVLLRYDEWGVAMSADGEWVLSTQPWNPSELSLLSTRTDARRKIGVENIERVDLAVFQPGSDAVLFSGNVPGEAARIFRVERSGGVPLPMTPSGIAFGFFAVSPDGDRFAASNVEGGMTIYSLAGGEPRHLDVLGQPIRWSDDANVVYTATLSRVPGHVYRVDVSSGDAEAIAALEPVDRAGVELVGPIVISSDGSTIVYGYARRTSTLFVVEGIE